MGILRLVLMFWLLMMTQAWSASTYYVRVAGGNISQCTGLTNADYSGTGTGQACAWSHPAWALGATGTSAHISGGDTVIIDDSSSAQYMMGYGMPNTSGCSNFNPADCYINSPPSGPDAQHPTHILGSSYASGCSTKPQFWGTLSTQRVFNLAYVNNIDVQCIEITDHSNCGFRVGNPICSETYPNAGTYGRDGIRGVSISGLTMKNIDIHGMAKEGMLLGDLNGSNLFSHINIDGNYFSGWDGDDRQISGTGSINNGTATMDHVNVRFNGCREAYPRSGSFTAADYAYCTDQNANGYGDGFGSYNTGGTWIVTNSNFSDNVSDGFDLLYENGVGDISIDKSVFEGNVGNQLKVSPRNLNLTNSVLIANCDYLTRAGKTWNTTANGFTCNDSNHCYLFSDCRANGTPISATAGRGGAWKISNNTAYTATNSGGSPFIEILDRNGICNGTESYTYKNNILVSNHSSTNWTAYYNGLTGACSTPYANAVTDHSIIYNFQSTISGGLNQSPVFTGAINPAIPSNLANITLQVTSPAKGGGASGVSFWNTSTDYNNYPQNSPVDMGGIQYNSSVVKASAGQMCTATTDCTSGTCSSFVCSGGGCTALAGSCSGTGPSGSCCSGYCTSGACTVPPTCGDTIVQGASGEVCDTTNLNGQTCLLQGFTAGTLSCASNCQSFDTSLCTSSVVFPLTPVLDNFNRANVGPEPSALWSSFFGDGSKVLSNTLALATGATGESGDYWNVNQAITDLEAYATISTLADFSLYIRADSVALTGYLLSYANAGHTVKIERLDTTTINTIATYSFTPSAGDAIGISAIGSTLKAWKRASGVWTLLGTITDATYPSGRIGVYMGNTTIRLDDFGGGPINPVVCGNNLKESGEACDGTDLSGQSCPSQGFASGSLSCSSNCQSFITTSCVAASTCGNNTKETGEVCDGTDINSQVCTNYGFTGGTVGCTSDCLNFTTTNCTGRITANGRQPAANRVFAQ